MAEIKPAETSTVSADIDKIEAACYEAIDDDLNTPIVIANLFEAVGLVNKIRDGHATATAEDIEKLHRLFDTFLFNILGMRAETADVADEKALEPYRGAVDLLLKVRSESKAKKDWATSDLIRDRLAALGFTVKDTKDGVEWSL